jgi:hypothetical protein
LSLHGKNRRSQLECQAAISTKKKIAPRDEVLGYFIAGGGQEEDFERIHQVILQDARDAIQAIDHGTYHSAGGGIMYLIAAQKPRQ